MAVCAAPAGSGAGREAGRPPLVVIAGARGTGKKRLLRALADGAPLGRCGGQGAAAEGTIDTKYYSARVHYSAIDVETGFGEEPLPRHAAAVVLLWDTERPETFAQARGAADAWRRGLPGEQAEGQQLEGEGPGRVQLCVAAAGLGGQAAARNEAAAAAARAGAVAEEEARAWCAEAGFEHLSCPLREPDLEAVRAHLRRMAEGSRGGLLDADTDGAAVRIVEALESHPWPGLELKTDRARHGAGEEQARRAAGAGVGAGHEPDEPPLVVILGARNTGKKRLLCALTDGILPGQGSTDCAVAHGTLDTKYYTAHVRYWAVDVQRGFGEGPLPRHAEAVILLWDSERPETFAQVCGAADAWRGPPEQDEGQQAEGPERVQLCVAAAGLGGQAASEAAAARAGAAEEEAQAWCAEAGFEHLSCPLREADLEAVRAHIRRAAEGGRGGLLDANTDGTVLRILEALECHSWPGLKLKSEEVAPGPSDEQATPAVDEGGYQLLAAEGDHLGRKERIVVPPSEEKKQTDSIGKEVPPGNGAGAAAVEPSNVARPQAATVPEKVPAKKRNNADDGDRAVETMERFADEIRSVRAMANDGQRRDRACELATLLAEALGVDDDSDSESGS